MILNATQHHSTVLKLARLVHKVPSKWNCNNYDFWLYFYTAVVTTIHSCPCSEKESFKWRDWGNSHPFASWTSMTGTFGTDQVHQNDISRLEQENHHLSRSNNCNRGYNCCVELHWHLSLDKFDSKIVQLKEKKIQFFWHVQHLLSV